MYRVVCFHFQSYLESTLQSVFDNMSEEEVNEVLVVVFIAELDQEYVARIAAQVRNGSLSFCDSGLDCWHSGTARIS